MSLMLSPEQRFFILIGALDAGGHIYPAAMHVSLTTRSPDLREKLIENFGGTVEGNKWYIKNSPKKYEKLLRVWAEKSVYRKSEVQEALINHLSKDR